MVRRNHDRFIAALLDRNNVLGVAPSNALPPHVVAKAFKFGKDKIRCSLGANLVRATALKLVAAESLYIAHKRGRRHRPNLGWRRWLCHRCRRALAGARKH